MRRNAASSVKEFLVRTTGCWALLFVAAHVYSNAAALSKVFDNVDLSGDQPHLAAAVPVVAIDPSRRGHIAVAWRLIDPLGGSNAQTAGNWVCHVSTSTDNGKTFEDHVIDWHMPSMPRCNAPWAAYGKRGDLYVAATLTGIAPAHAVNDTSSGTSAPEPGALPPGTPAKAAAPPPHPGGTAGLMISHDDGRTWDPTVSVIPSNALDRFAIDASIPEESKRVPWDGARGAIDLTTNAVYISGAFPAFPGGEAHSQRFYSVSSDAGASFGLIRAFGDAAWPERWDGDIAAAGGDFIVSYIADSTPDPATRCPCAVVGVSHDDGRTLVHELIAESGEFDLDTYVHYPEVAADPVHRGRFAAVLVSADKNNVSLFITRDRGRHWTRLQPVQPPDVKSVTRPSVSFSPSGVAVLAWRGVHGDGSYDIYAASAVGNHVGPSLKASSSSSHTPPAWLKTYAVRGDFHTSVAVDRSYAHLSWADARNSTDVRVEYAHMPLRDLLH